MREAIRVRVAGSTARRVLAEPGEGAVFAAFERALYVEGERGLVCLGPLCLGRGPLNLLCADWRPGAVKPGTPAWWSRGEIRLAGGTVFSLAEAVDWRPPRPADWRPADLRRGLSALARAAARRAPPEGLGRLIPALVDGAPRAAEDAASPLLRRAASGIAALAEWLAWGAGPAPPSAVCELIGLGPGLTPSGDDLLGGVLIALHALGRPDATERLSAWALPLAATRTGLISRAHLAAAAAGEGAEPLHRVLAAICAGAQAGWEDELDTIAGMGHCSGWDALAGIALAGAAFAGIHADGLAMTATPVVG